MSILMYLILGVAIGYWFGLQKGKAGAEKGYDVMKDPAKWEKMRALLRSKAEITNDDVQTALGVSDATATRYLEMLEKTGDVEQMGDTGRGVVYQTKK